jgi:hypothetical protein
MNGVRVKIGYYCGMYVLICDHVLSVRVRKRFGYYSEMYLLIYDYVSNGIYMPFWGGSLIVLHLMIILDHLSITMSPSDLVLPAWVGCIPVVVQHQADADG